MTEIVFHKASHRENYTAWHDGQLIGYIWRYKEKGKLRYEAGLKDGNVRAPAKSSLKLAKESLQRMYARSKAAA